MKKHKLIKQIGVISVSLIVMFNCANSYAQDNQKEKKRKILKIRRLISKTLRSIDKAYRNNEIDLDTKITYKIQTVEDIGSVPEKYKPDIYKWGKPEAKYYKDIVKRIRLEAFKEWYKLEYTTHKKLRPYLKNMEIDVRDKDITHIIGRRPKNNLVKKAYIKGEIDIDQVFLYQFGPREEIPERFIPEPPPPPIHPFQDDFRIVDTGFLPKYSRYLKPETKEKIKLHHWKKEYSNKVNIKIDSPKGGAETYTGEVKIKGKITSTSPEMYDITSAWARVGGERKEIKLGSKKYEESEFDKNSNWAETVKKFEKIYGEETGEYLREYYAGPGKIRRPFEVMVKLPRFNKNVIRIGAKNSGGQSAGAKILVTYYDGTDKEPPKVEIIKPKGDSILHKGHTVEGKGKEILVLVKAKDNKRLLRVELYFNGELTYTDYDENRKARRDEYFRLGAPAKTGKNKIKVIAYDIGNNKESDKIKVVYRPKKEE